MFLFVSKTCPIYVYSILYYNTSIREQTKHGLTYFFESGLMICLRAYDTGEIQNTFSIFSAHHTRLSLVLEAGYLSRHKS